jgi:hypothetical protein
LGHFYTRISRRTAAFILGVAGISDSDIPEAFHHFSGIVIGAVIDNDDFKIRVGLAQKARYCPVDEVGTVVSWDDNANLWSLFCVS